MASSADINKVKDNIEDDAAERGWTDPYIAARLDAGASVNRVSETYWRKRAQATIELVNTSEAGSSRGNDAVYSRMVAQADYYAGLALVEEAVAPETAAVDRVGGFNLKRV
jgi:hypothetical protein